MSIQRIPLNVNGVGREVLCDPERDSLVDVVRRLGLTGTKIGCGTGQCGACTFLLDGEVTRSCVKKMKHVRADARVETIEGLGSPENLHPLQRAFITYAGVQCGFCLPGFIMSARGAAHAQLRSDAGRGPRKEALKKEQGRHVGSKKIQKKSPFSF